MIEAVWYGLIAAFTFIGFVCAVCFTVLHFYKPDGCGKYILSVPENAPRHEIERLLYGAHLRSMIFGNLLFDETVVCYTGSSEECLKTVLNSASEYGITCISGKENDGSGA